MSTLIQKTFRGKLVSVTSSDTKAYISIYDICRALGNSDNTALNRRIAAYGEVIGHHKHRMASYDALLGYAESSRRYRRKPHCGELYDWLLSEFESTEQKPKPAPIITGQSIEIAMAEVEAQLKPKRPVPEYLRIEIERAMAVLPSPD